jgi:hypothetical protein
MKREYVAQERETYVISLCVCGGLCVNNNVFIQMTAETVKRYFAIQEREHYSRSEANLTQLYLFSRLRFQWLCCISVYL